MEKNYKYFTLISTLFVTVLITSNITSTKIVDVFGLTFDGGTILFPLSYIFGDILTEVYGYKNARRVIWMGFLGALLMTLSIIGVGLLPAAGFWDAQSAYETILMYTPRIIIASLIAYTAGEFVNSYILAKMKVKMKGKLLPIRTITSTLGGQLIDTSVFILVAFYGIFSNQEILAIFIANYILKVGIEVLFTPITVYIVNFLKKKEHEDYYDTHTNFSPFKVFS